MTKKLNVAVVGATGNVGRKILEILIERQFPINNCYALASRSSMGKKVSYGEDNVITVDALENFDFSKADLIFSAVGSSVIKDYAKKATNKGCVIIDKSSYFRMDTDVPLIVPEVNPQLITSIPEKRIIASPNCCVIPLVTVLSPLHNAAKIKRIILSTYQSVSGAGKEYMDDLYNQTKSIYLLNEAIQSKFERKIAFNIIPKIDSFSLNGDTLEEEKICNEAKKILGNNIQITATSVRVPVFIGHSLSVNVEFANLLQAKEAEEILEEAEGITLLSQDSTMQYITPAEAAGEDTVYVSRIRKDKSAPNGLNLWIVADNLRKGAATNAVQIAEEIKNLI